jgi:hypothetical protein
MDWPCCIQKGCRNFSKINIISPPVKKIIINKTDHLPTKQVGLDSRNLSLDRRAHLVQHRLALEQQINHQEYHLDLGLEALEILLQVDLVLLDPLFLAKIPLPQVDLVQILSVVLSQLLACQGLELLKLEVNLDLCNLEVGLEHHNLEVGLECHNLEVGLECPEGDVPNPLPDCDVPNPLPDCGIPNPLPDCGIPNPLPDCGVPNPLPDCKDPNSLPV